MLSSTVVPIEVLTDSARDEMFALFSRYYAATSSNRFEADLSAKHRVVLLRDEAGVIRGFSTLAIERMVIEEQPIRIVFSGDTIIDRPHWGSQAFAFAWIREIGRIAASAPEEPLYWLLIVKGHRTFKYLSAFGLQFVPNWQGPDSPRLTEMKDAIATARFGRNYDIASGLVRYETSRGHLTPEWAEVSPREARRADVRYFLERNPGYARGDELVCLCELAPHNMRPLTRRLFDQGRRT